MKEFIKSLNTAKTLMELITLASKSTRPDDVAYKITETSVDSGLIAVDVYRLEDRSVTDDHDDVSLFAAATYQFSEDGSRVDPERDHFVDFLKGMMLRYDGTIEGIMIRIGTDSSKYPYTISSCELDSAGYTFHCNARGGCPARSFRVEYTELNIG